MTSSRPKLLHLATADSTVRFMLLGQLIRYQDAGYDVTAMSAPGPWVDEIEAAGIRFIPWGAATRAWSPASDLRAARELARVLRRERFDIVHTHNPKPGVLGRIAARLTRTPLIINTIHGLYSPPGDAFSLRRLALGAEWMAARFSHHELYQSAEDLARARRLRIASRARSGYLGNGVDLGRFDPTTIEPSRTAALRLAWGIPEGVPVVGMVGRLVAEKGWAEFAEAARLLQVDHRDAVFLAIGPDDGAKADAIDPADLAGPLTACGMVVDMPAALALLDVFVLASHREGFPRAAIEAAAMGRASVLTDIRGCREVVRHGQTGLLTPVRDPAALAEAIGVLLSDADLRARLGRAAADRAHAEFDEGIVARRTLEVYRRMLPSRGASGGHRKAMSA